MAAAALLDRAGFVHFGRYGRALVRGVPASVIPAFEIKHRTGALLPGGCTAACLVPCLAMHATMMTEKIVRRRVCVPAGFNADLLDLITADTACMRDPVCEGGGQSRHAARLMRGDILAAEARRIHERQRARPA